ncbi:hypothetical protein B0H34DRAFT_713464 [Crassisporium funariophilum]|nr:hypothetical protein B0H34DRAFT_713464 [Crassisporium funariophilum]
MVKLTSSIFHAFVVVPTLSLASQTIRAGLLGRGFEGIGTAVAIRDELEQIYGREFINDIRKRSPISVALLYQLSQLRKHHFYKPAPQRRDLEEIYGRALTGDLEERKPHGFGSFKHIEEREPHFSLGGVFKVAEHLLRRDLDTEVLERDEDGLLDRDFNDLYDDLD